MSWPPAGHDRERELFEGPPEEPPGEPGKTLPEQVEGDHAYRDERPIPDDYEPRECPACKEPGEDLPEDQARCDTPACRVTTYQTTTPPDARR
jgi:hypothetical protein